MGKVYKVRNVISDRVEAMKVLLPDLANVPELADRFMREIKVLATLEHPHIAALRTAQRVDNQLLMVMELVEGVTVEENLENGPLPVDQAVDIIAQVLAALNYAHGRGVIHRDIKPANMMVTEGGVVKLMDFGIAKAAGDRKLTMTGTTLGSLFYMSPEQIKGGDLDPRSDLYSLGVSLYEMVTGARPFKGDSDFSIMSAHLETPPVPPVEVDPRLPAALNEIILMSIVKDPAKRFQSATAFAAAIASVGGHVPASAAARSPQTKAAAAAPSAPAKAPPDSGSSRHGLYMALGAVVFFLVLVVGAIVVPKLMRTRAGESPASTRRESLPAASSEQQPAPSQLAPAEPATLQESPPVASQPAAAKAGAGQARPQAQRQQYTQPQTRQQLEPQAPIQQPAAAQPAAQAPAADLAKAAALRETQKAWPMLASRAGAISAPPEPATGAAAIRLRASWRHLLILEEDGALHGPGRSRHLGEGPRSGQGAHGERRARDPDPGEVPGALMWLSGTPAGVVCVLAAAAAVYILAGYPLLLALAPFRRSPAIRKDLSFQRSATIVLAVRDGGRFLRAKLESLLALEYPKDLLEILVVSDGSTDETDSIAGEFAGRGVRLLRQSQQGKAAALNAGMARATGEILFFTDVRQPLDPPALSHLVANFADPSVGAATGELRLQESEPGVQADRPLLAVRDLGAQAALRDPLGVPGLGLHLRAAARSGGVHSCRHARRRRGVGDPGLSRRLSGDFGYGSDGVRLSRGFRRGIPPPVARDGRRLAGLRSASPVVPAWESDVAAFPFAQVRPAGAAVGAGGCRRGGGGPARVAPGGLCGGGRAGSRGIGLIGPPDAQEVPAQAFLFAGSDIPVNEHRGAAVVRGVLRRASPVFSPTRVEAGGSKGTSAKAG